MSHTEYADKMPVLRNKRRSADLEDGLPPLGNNRKKKSSPSAEIESETTREKIQASRENEATTTDAQDQDQEQPAPAQKQAQAQDQDSAHKNPVNSPTDATAVDDSVFLGDSQDIFYTANNVADWTAADEDEIVSFLDYREPAGDMEMGTGPLPKGLRRADGSPVRGIMRLTPSPSPSPTLSDRHVAFRSGNFAKRPPPPKSPTQAQEPAPNPGATSTSTSSSPDRVSPAWMRQMSRLLDQKMHGLARSEEVHRVNNKVNKVSGEIGEQRGEMESLKLRIDEIQSRQLEKKDIVTTVREEIKRNEEEKKAKTPSAPANALVLPPQTTTVDLASSGSSTSSAASSFIGRGDTASCWGGSSGSSGFLAGAATKEQEQARRASFDASCRSLIIWPIGGKTEREMHLALQSFLTGALDFRAQEISALEIMRIYRFDLPARTMAHTAIRVVFKAQRGRQSIVRKSRLLGRYVNTETRQPTEGFRMDIPDYLATDFRTLEDTGYQLREEYGDELRKYIKYDEDTLGLYLEVRFPADNRWTRITPLLAREIVEYGNREIAEGIKKRMRRRSMERGASLSTTTSVPSLAAALLPPPQRQIAEARTRHNSAMSGVEEGAPLVDLVSPSSACSNQNVLAASKPPSANRRPTSTSTPLQPSPATSNTQSTRGQRSQAAVARATEEQSAILRSGTWSPIIRQ